MVKSADFDLSFAAEFYCNTKNMFIIYFYIFMSSKLDEKQQILGFFFSNLTLNAEKLDLEMREPFKYMSKSQNQHVWRGFVDAFRNCELIFGFGLERVQFAFNIFGIAQIVC
jgi:hypothetical protein